MPSVPIGMRLALVSEFRMRWREQQQRGGWVAALAQFAAVLFLLPIMAPALAPLPPSAVARILAGAGQGLWGAWVLSAAIFRCDFSRRASLRWWALQPGFWPSYVVGAVLAPTSPLIVAGSTVAVIGMAVSLHVAPSRIPLVVLALWIFVLATLRVTSIIILLNRPGGRKALRASGYACAAGLATWNELTHGLAPARWLIGSATAPGAHAALKIGQLLILLLVLGALGGWLARWDLLGGQGERRFTRFGAGLLKAGSGAARALQRASLLGWLRTGRVTIPSAFGAVWMPCYLLLDRQSSGTAGAVVASCAFALLFPYWIRGNLLGMDVGGAWRYACTAVTPSTAMIERGVALTLLQCAILVPSFAGGLAWRPAGWVGIAAAVAFVVATVALEDAAGMPLSRRFPEPAGRSDDNPDLTPGALWMMVIAFVWPTIFVVAFVVAWPSRAEWYWPWAVAAVCLLIRWLAIRRLRRDENDVWSERILTRLGAL